MIRFSVTVRTTTTRFSYTAIAPNSCAIVDSAMDLFGVCSVAVFPTKEQSRG